MKDAVVIKGNKAGMTVYLEKDLDFDEVLQAIAKKFKATAKFRAVLPWHKKRTAAGR